MYQSEVKSNLQYVSAPPPVNPAISPDSSSPSAYMTTSTTTAASLAPVSTPNLHFQSSSSSSSFTNHLQQLHSIPDAWLASTSSLPPTSHHQNSYESLPPTSTYFSQPRQTPSYAKLRRSQMLALGCKHGGPTIGGKRTFRALRDEREEGCGSTNGSGSPGDSGGTLEGVNGTSAGSGTVSTTKQCRVCGDRAVNHNFGQLTCESCKAFFRRNAHKDLTCTSKSGEHVVSPSTRRECPACRLKRCFLIGMRPDLIQVRKKDGTKPRWLDKYPAAAQVHEHHIARSDVSKISRLQQNSSPGDNGQCDLYALAYARYSDTPHQLNSGGSTQLMKDGRGFETYPPEATYLAPHPPPTPLPSQNSGGVYEENGRGVPAMLAGEMDSVSSGFRSKLDIPSPHYRISDCVVLTNPLADENARQKGSGIWSQGVTSNFPLPVSNTTWLPPPVSNYPISHFQSGDMLLLDSFNTEHSLLSNLQIRERPAFDAYSSLQPTESRSGASSGSTASPSVGSSVPNFGSGSSDTTQGNFNTNELKPAIAEWVQSVEPDTGSGYLQNLSPLRSKVFGPVTSDLRPSLLPPLEGDQWFNRLTLAWRSAWREGMFPNPSQVRFHLDLDAIPTGDDPEDWRLTLANLWSDLLLRRVADFASNLFQPLHGDSVPVDIQLSPTLLGWIFKNRLVNCVPIILARALVRSSELNGSSTSPVSQPQNDIADDGGSSPRSLRDCEAPLGRTSSMSPPTNGGGKAKAPTLSVGFQVLPQHHVLISLSQLNAKLAENQTTTTYPMLQYLDAYICELNKFLTEQTLLLGAYMAVKLTEPPIPEELMQTLLSEADVRQIHCLNVKFLNLFGMAADHVASLIVNGESSDSLQTQTKAMNDAICRRTKLPDFLSWGRHFDDNMKSLLYDIWNANRHKPQAFISPGLAAFCDHSSQSSTMNLLHLLSAPASDEIPDIVQ